MALSLRRNTSDGLVGLDIDGAYVAAAQLDSEGVGHAASHDLEPGIVRDGEVVDGDRLTDALKDFFKAEDLPRHVRLGVANQQIVVRHIEMPKIANEKERDAAIRFQTAETLAMPLGDAVIDYQIVGETQNEDGAPRARVLVVAARMSMITRLVDSVRRAGLKPDGIDLNAFALIRTLGDAPEPDSPARVYCHLGGVANVAVGLGSVCLFTRPLTAPWDEGEGSLEALAEEMRLSIEYYRAQADVPPAGDLVISGPGAQIDGLDDRITDMVGLPTSVAEPLGRLGAAPFPSHDDPFRHTVSLGLAMGAAA
jgi:type IV pilus assembly protein PilM